jgi:hypothetical protein
VIGLTALHIAGKYEEIYPPELKHYLRIDTTIKKEKILDTEFKILQALDFELTFPTILRFIERFVRVS